MDRCLVSSYCSESFCLDLGTGIIHRPVARDVQLGLESSLRLISTFLDGPESVHPEPTLLQHLHAKLIPLQKGVCFGNPNV